MARTWNYIADLRFLNVTRVELYFINEGNLNELIIDILPEKKNEDVEDNFGEEDEEEDNGIISA